MISDDTYCMMKNSDLRTENRSGWKSKPTFDASGTNIIPMGARGKNAKLPENSMSSGFLPSRRSQHPPAFHQNNRLNSNAAMHDYRPLKRDRSGDNFLAHKMNPNSKSEVRDIYGNKPYNDRSFYREAGKTELQPILENRDAQAVHLQDIMLPKGAGRNVTSTRRSV